MTSPRVEQAGLVVEDHSCASPTAAWVPGPPKLLLGAIVAMSLLHLILPVASLQPPALRLLGLLPLAAGLAMNLLADQALKIAGTTVKPRLTSTALVTGGVFRVTRNPMYVGFVLLLAGLWLLLGSLTPGLAVGAFTVLMDRYFMRPEEEKLALTFGASYAAYRGRVRRWL
jgi:protein-S-isoprenylcysteine O-methyltransferase Ste14